MLYTVTHKTIYEYGDTVPECFNIVRLNPRPVFDQLCLDHQLEIFPRPDDLVEREDFFGNLIEQFSIHIPHESLTVTAVNRIDVTKRDYPALSTTPAWEEIAKLNLETNLLAAHFSRNSPRVSCSASTAEYARVSFTAGRPIAEAAEDLTRRIFKDFEFDPDATTVSTPVEEVFRKRAGVCQDFAHLQIACLRSLNLPSRYVSGYLRTIPPPGKERLVGADASHAWCSVFCGDAGWFDFDPTNNMIPQTDHVTVGWGRDYSDVCPIQGVFTGGGQTVMKVSVDVATEGT
ncbi:MAG: transglutaminase N-terminal domain-containing protein [Mariniblastus sp.]